MFDLRRRKTELELRNFVSANVLSPSACENLEQIRACILVLCVKIEELEANAEPVPPWMSSLLARYNARQNSILLTDFIKIYH